MVALTASCFRGSEWRGHPFGPSVDECTFLFTTDPRRKQ